MLWPSFKVAYSLTSRLTHTASHRPSTRGLEEEEGMYRGREGQWAFLLHRLSGLAILAYFLLHVVSISLVMFGEQAYMRLHTLYELPIFSLGLILVTAGVVYHALNGLRIIVMDFTGTGVAYQRQMFYGVLALTLLATAYTAFVVIGRLLRGEA